MGIICSLLSVLQILAMVSACVLVFIGLVVWVMSRLRTRESLLLMAGGLMLGIVPTLLNVYLVPAITTACGD